MTDPPSPRAIATHKALVELLDSVVWRLAVVDQDVLDRALSAVALNQCLHPEAMPVGPRLEKQIRVGMVESMSIPALSPRSSETDTL